MKKGNFLSGILGFVFGDSSAKVKQPSSMHAQIAREMDDVIGELKNINNAIATQGQPVSSSERSRLERLGRKYAHLRSEMDERDANSAAIGESGKQP